MRASRANEVSSARRRLCVALWLARLSAAGAVLAAPGLSQAEPTDPGASQAEPTDPMALFREGVRLRKEGKIDEACALFAESHRLEPTAGKLLNIASCHEREGKFATARAEFLAASRLYEDRGEGDGVAECRRRLELLEPRVSRLTVRVERPAQGLRVNYDGRVVGPDEFGRPFFVDPGEHRVVAEAPGRATFRAFVRVGPEGGVTIVDVPALAERRPAVASTGRQTAGYIAGGAGLAALSAGIVFGAMALSNNAKAEDACPAAGQCSPGVATFYRDRADAQAWVANVGVGAGLLGLAAGGYLLLTAPGAAPKAGPKAHAGATLAARPFGLEAVVRF